MQAQQRLLEGSPVQTLLAPQPAVLLKRCCV